MQNKNQKFKTGLLGFMAIFMLSFPFVSIPNKSKLIFSVPVLYVYIFGVWISLIIAVIVITERPRRKPKKKSE